MKKAVWLLIFIISVGNVFAATIKVVDGTYESDALTSKVNEQLEKIATDLNDDDLVKLAGNQDDFTLSNANANASNIIVGSLYSGLDAGIAAIGFTAGGSLTNPGKAEDFIDDVKDGKDTAVGGAIGGFGVNAIYNGDNLPSLPIKGLMFETKFAVFSNEDLAGTGVVYSSFLLGAGARYKIASLPVQRQMFKLRALTVGTGLYYAQSDIEFEADPIKKNSDPEEVEGNEVTTKTKTTLDFSIANKAVIIPVEAVTSAQTLYFLNFIAGTGFDLVLGQTKTTVSSDSQIKVYQNGILQTPTSDPDLELTDSETKKMPTILRYKLIFGVGLNLGPTRIEVPIAYYPTNGYAVSAVVGASF